jgi:hypothetical protein
MDTVVNLLEIGEAIDRTANYCSIRSSTVYMTDRSFIQ